MRQRNILTTLMMTITGLSFTLSILTGCNETEDDYPRTSYTSGTYIFENVSGTGTEWKNPYYDDDDSQYYKCDGNEQTITLRLKSVSSPEIPYPEKIRIEQVFVSNKRGDNLSKDCCRIWTDNENNEPVIKISLEKNDTGEEREVAIWITADPYEYEIFKIRESHKTIYCALVVIMQSPLDAETETFRLKARYKGMEYNTEASIDENGDMIFANPEYAELMQTIDAAPDVEMMVLDSETFYYYDAEDISNNMPYRDVMAIKPSMQSTRGADDFSSAYLGYVALYDNDHFGGRYISKGLDNFHFTWNIQSLMDYDMNDKVTSIVTAFNSDDPLVCTVLTIWDDTDYNHGDKNRKKHRISIVACRQAPVVAVEDLKKVKKIGSSKSWNDCISSISFHFGYIDRLMLDY